MKQCETPEEQGTGLQMGESDLDNRKSWQRQLYTRQERDRLRRQKKVLNTDSKAYRLAERMHDQEGSRNARNKVDNV